MAAGRLVGVVDARTGGVTVRRLVVEDGRRVLRAKVPAWPDVVVTTDKGGTDLRHGGVRRRRGLTDAVERRRPIRILVGGIPVRPVTTRRCRTRSQQRSGAPERVAAIR